MALLLFALVFLLTRLSYRPPNPKPEGTPAVEFSAGRARRLLQELLSDGAAHPVGSAANARIRERILTGFRRFGYRPEVEPGFACSPSGNCGAVQNVLARLPGRVPGGAVLLAAHYDSVESGPGAADDLASVAAMLEIARILKSGPPPRNSVLFLADDGEEAGLLGARVFAAGPHASEVAAAVNLEARGTAGPSLMFETGRDDAGLIRLWARTASRPVASSLFATIYERMPIPTDFAVFKHAGMPGLNFAFIGSPPHYHTPLDSPANLSPASLQHQGDNALAAVRGLAAADLRHRPTGAAVFFDLLGRRLIWWPQSWALPLALLALAAVAAPVLLGLRRHRLRGADLARGALCLAAILLGCGLAAFVLHGALRATGALRVSWVADRRPSTAAFWLLPLAVGGTISAMAARRAGAAGLWAGVWAGWALLGLAVTWLLPGASFLLVVPALAAGLAALPWAVSAPTREPFPLISILPATVAALLWFPVAHFLDDGLGAEGLVAVTLLVAFCMSTLAPLFAPPRRRLPALVPAAAAVAVLVASEFALGAPTFTRQSPQKIGLGYHEEAGSGTGRWLVFGDLPAPPALHQAAALTIQPPFPWSPRDEQVEAAPAPGQGLEAPQLAVETDSVAGGRRRLRLRLRSPRGAPVASLILPRAAGAESLAMAGAEVPRQPDGSFATEGDWHVLTCATLPQEGVAIDLVLRQITPLSVYISDGSPGLPPLAAGRVLAASRPETSVGLGDLTMVSRRLTL